MPSAAESIPSLDRFLDHSMRAILDTTSGPRALEMAATIIENDRWNSFDRWHDTTQNLTAAYEACGAKSEIYRIPTGGTLGDGRWIIPQAADVIDATLEMGEPTRRTLAEFKNYPWHVVQWSAATPAEGIEADVVIIDSLDQLSAKKHSLRGKFVLTRLDPWRHRVRFSEASVAGLICDQPVAGCHGAVAWTKFGWGGLNLSDTAPPIVGFAISAMEGDALRAVAAQGATLRVRAKLDIRRYAGSHDVVSGIIRGEQDPDSEIWAVAHSCEPGTLDNASGGAACVEIAQVLNELIQRGDLPPPKRTIRLLHAYECYGFFHYLEHGFRLQPPLAGVCIDTIGAKPEVCGGMLSWHNTVPGSASFVDDIGEIILGAALRERPVYKLARKPFLSTEDTLLGDPRYGFPCPWITNHPCRGYHSSADTIDLIDPDGIGVCAAAMAAYLYYLASASTDEALEIVRSQTGRVARATGIEHRATLDRLSRLTLMGNHEKLSKDFAEMTQVVPQGTAISQPDSTLSLIPLRRRPLAPTAENVWPHLREKLDPAFPKWAAYWADGERTIGEIAELLALHPEGVQPIETVIAYFEALAELGYVELLRRKDLLTAEQLAVDFRNLGLRPGMDLIVHSSMKSIGPVLGGPAAIIDAILSLIGPAGTLLAPTFNHHHALAFNPLVSPTTDGTIPEAMWRRTDAKRSLHPSHSVAAIGPRADEYLRDHLTVGVWAAESPIGRLIANDGYILSVGVGHDRSTAYHVAEIAMNVPCLDQFGSIDRIAREDGSLESVRGLAWRDGECPVDPAGIDDILKDNQRHAKVGRANATFAKANDVFNARREQLGDRCATCSIRPHRRNIP